MQDGILILAIVAVVGILVVLRNTWCWYVDQKEQKKHAAGLAYIAKIDKITRGFYECVREYSKTVEGDTAIVPEKVLTFMIEHLPPQQRYCTRGESRENLWLYGKTFVSEE